MICLLVALVLGAQVAESQLRTGAIAGTVVSDEDSPRSVRRVVVTLNSSDLALRQTAITDDEGRFAFVNLPAGRYSLGASKRGWISGALGAKAPGRMGRPLRLAASERATATIRIGRGAVITGTVLDQAGQPVDGVTIRVVKSGYSANS